ncbi:hypothetical protein C3438_19300 [Bacillus velezensis]|uniref:hypothetical protein n=1 Tax=Bacillus velezensis TaxID=492670 RepID=UPI000CDFFAB3|nr:hypothetical protein [Bacillus velezensis]AVB11478.1 hypothetical protein C3438_19300 [Bacillus velezensis]UBM47586.1 hypothetical protein LAZ98_09285 [Bacillus velezensis]WJM64524.1 hypothetical protein QTN48_11875 [Bacillus velezensis]
MSEKDYFIQGELCIPFFGRIKAKNEEEALLFAYQSIKKKLRNKTGKMGFLQKDHEKYEALFDVDIMCTEDAELTTSYAEEIDDSFENGDYKSSQLLSSK